MSVFIRSDKKGGNSMLTLVPVSDQAKHIAYILDKAIRGNLGAIATVKLDPSNYGVSRGASISELRSASEKAKMLYTTIDMAISGEATAIATIKSRPALSYML